MKSNKLLIGCVIVLLLVLGFVLVAGLVGILVIPGLNKAESEGQTPAGTTATLVNINLPLNGAELPSGQPVGVYAEAVSGTPVKDLELWVDGVFVPTRMSTSPDGQIPFNATWLWTPAEDGNYRLVVRAIGQDNAVTVSNVVRVAVLPADEIVAINTNTSPGGTIPAPQTPSGAENPPSTGSAPEGGEASEGSEATEGQAGPPGESATQPEEPAEAAPEPEEEPAPEPAVPAEFPGAPGLQGLVQQCDASLLIKDNSGEEENFMLYRLDPSSAGFSLIATLDEHPDTGEFTYIDAGLGFGKYTYYIASFDGTSETPSGLVNLEISAAQCAAASPPFFGIDGALLTTSKQVDRLYCYLSVNQGPWTRIPPGSNNFIYPTASGFKLGSYLDALISPPPPGGVTLELECWGWSGDTLQYLGYLKQSFGKGPLKLIGKEFSLAGTAVEIAVPEKKLNSISPNIAPPYNPEFIQDHAACLGRYAGILAQTTAETVCNFMQDGYITLIWDWIPGCAYEPCPFNIADMDGFHIYRDSPGLDPVLVVSIINPKIHIAIIPPGSSGGGTVPPKYFVRAYKGDQESMDSPHISSSTPKYSVVLKNPSLRDTTVSRHKTSWYSADEYNEKDRFPETEATVGYFYGPRSSDSYGSPIWDFGIDEIVSSYSNLQVHFTLSEIKAPVTRAVLHWKFKNSKAYGSGVADSPLCRVALVDRMNGAVITQYPAPGIDVTTIVRSWMQQTGIQKSGFIFANGMTSLPFSETGNGCYFTIGDFELEVETAGT